MLTGAECFLYYLITREWVNISIFALVLINKTKAYKLQ